jgi:replicative DNA helicase
MISDNVISTGFLSLDQLLNGGFHGGSLHLVAARPGMGNTSLASQLVVNMATTSGETIYFQSLESTLMQMEGRLMRQFGDGLSLAERPVVMDYSFPITPNQMQKNLLNTQNLGAAVIDRVSLMVPDKGHRRAMNKEDHCGIIRDLKRMAEDLQIPIIGLAHLSRRVEQRKDHHPKLSDFRYINDAVAQHADTVLFPYRDAYYHYEYPSSAAEMIVAKNRFGKTGTLKFLWDSDTATFSEVKNEDSAQNAILFRL